MRTLESAPRHTALFLCAFLSLSPSLAFLAPSCYRRRRPRTPEFRRSFFPAREFSPENADFLAPNDFSFSSSSSFSSCTATSDLGSRSPAGTARGQKDVSTARARTRSNRVVLLEHTERKRARLALARSCAELRKSRMLRYARASSRRVTFSLFLSFAFSHALSRGETGATELRGIRGGYKSAAGSERGGDLATGICNELDTQGSRRGTGRLRGMKGDEGWQREEGGTNESGVAQGPLVRVRYPERRTMLLLN